MAAAGVGAIAVVAATIAVVVVVAIVVVVGIVAVVVAGRLVGWMKGEQIASLASPDPWPCHSPTSGGSGTFAGLGSLLQKNQKQRK